MENNVELNNIELDNTGVNTPAQSVLMQIHSKHRMTSLPGIFIRRKHMSSGGL